MNFFYSLSVLVFLSNFDTNHFQIGLERQRRQTQSCNIANVNGTTLSIKDIFIGRCYYFINVLQKQNCEFDSKKYNCTTIWDSFYTISLKNKQNISDYDTYLDLVDQKIPANTSLFWSGTYTQAHECNIIYVLFY
jgi:hypothetical protein